MIAPYTWPDKTLYDILARQEYLGHTITAKTHKVSLSLIHIFENEVTQLAEPTEQEIRQMREEIEEAKKEKSRAYHRQYSSCLLYTS